MSCTLKPTEHISPGKEQELYPNSKNPPRTRPVNSGYGYEKLKKGVWGGHTKNGYWYRYAMGIDIGMGTGLDIGITHPVSKFFCKLK